MAMQLMFVATKVSASLWIALVALALLLMPNSTQASIMPLTEEDGHSDLLAGTGSATGNFTAGVLTINSLKTYTALDIGPGTGADYNQFNISLAVSGVAIDSSGHVTDGGLVSIMCTGIAGTNPLIAAFPGTAKNAPLLTGTVVDVAMGVHDPIWNPVGDNNMQVVFDITGGSLAPAFSIGGADRSVLVMKFTDLPDNFSSDFTLSGGTIDVIGPVPEPSSVALGSLGVMFLLAKGLRRRSVRR